MRRQLALVWTLARKDGRLFLSDKRAAALCFAVPVVLASAFGLIFSRPGDRMAPVKLPVMVVDEDDSTLSRQLVADFLASRHADAKAVDRPAAEASVAARRGGVAVVLPPGFGQRLGERPGLSRPSEDRPSVEILHHPLSALEAQWAEGVLTEVVMRRLAQTYLGPVLGNNPTVLDRPFTPAHVTVPDAAKVPFNAYSHSFCGMTLQYLLFWGMESGLLLLRERQRGIWRRVRAAPVPLWAVLMGKAVATAGIAFLQVLVTFGFGYLVFGVTVSGSWAGFAGLAVLVSLLAAATGLLVAAVGGTEARARSVCILAILSVSMLGGLWLPSFLLPGWVQQFSAALPTTWAMRGLDGVTWQGHGLGTVWPCLAAVAGFTAIFLAAAVARLSWTEARRRRGFA